MTAETLGRLKAGRVVVTGANGNLGRKLIHALVTSGRCDEVVGIDLDPPPADAEHHACLRRVTADLARRDDRRWIDAVRGADAIVHFAAQMPHVVATWEDAAVSFAMTASLVAEAKQLRRFVFASSNHVMGGYKETDVATTPAALTTALPPWAGTRFVLDGEVSTSAPYATAKLMGERLLAVNAAFEGFTAVSLRIGWCQPGENRPETISASGTPVGQFGEPSPSELADLRWFRNMWLSNVDFCGFCVAALAADAAAWPTPAVVVNATSANRDSPWDLTPARELLHYVPADDIWSRLAG